MEVNYVRSVYFGGYEIETTVTDQAYAVENWVRSFPPGWKRIVGLDCEWMPFFYNNQDNITAVLQLCVETKCIIIQMSYLEYIPQALADFLENPNNYFAGVGVGADVSRLTADYGLSCSSTADIQTIAREEWNWSNLPGLKNILRHVEGLVMEKPQHIRLSNWQNRDLDPEQVEYACIDAFACYKIGYNLRRRIDAFIY